MPIPSSQSERDAYAAGRPLPDDWLLSVVMPIYNEAATLKEIVTRICALPLRKEIVLVDDGSKDACRELIDEIHRSQSEDSVNRIVVARHPMNRGKGAAIRTGMTRAMGDIVIIQDADLEYEPADYVRLVQPIVEGAADVVYGSRFLDGRQPLSRWSSQYIGNRVLTFTSNLFTRLALSDMETCYKVLSRPAIDLLLPLLKEERFGFEPEVTARIARHGFRVAELPVTYAPRSRAEGKKIGWRDGVQSLWCVVRYGLKD